MPPNIRPGSAPLITLMPCASIAFKPCFQCNGRAVPCDPTSTTARGRISKKQQKRQSDGTHLPKMTIRARVPARHTKGPESFRQTLCAVVCSMRVRPRACRSRHATWSRRTLRPLAHPYPCGGAASDGRNVRNGPCCCMVWCSGTAPTHNPAHIVLPLGMAALCAVVACHHISYHGIHQVKAAHQNLSLTEH